MTWPHLLGETRAWSSTTFFTIQAVLWVVTLAVGYPERDFYRNRKAALKKSGAWRFRGANRAEKLGTSGQPIDPDDWPAVRPYVEWTLRLWTTPRRRAVGVLSVVFFLWPIAITVAIDAARGNWGGVVLGLCFSLPFLAIFIRFARLPGRVRRTAEVNGWDLQAA